MYLGFEVYSALCSKNIGDGPIIVAPSTYQSNIFFGVANSTPKERIHVWNQLVHLLNKQINNQMGEHMFSSEARTI